MEELIILQESLEIATVAGYREEWRQILATGRSDVAVVLDQLTRIDTAGLQLLLALRASVREQGKTFRFRGESEALRNHAAALGFSDLLDSLRPNLDPTHSGNTTRDLRTGLQ